VLSKRALSAPPAAASPPPAPLASKAQATGPRGAPADEMFGRRLNDIPCSSLYINVR
jgi:hypothetical protein